MKHIDNRYWMEITLLTVLLAGLAWLSFTLVFPGQYPAILPAMFALIVVATITGQSILTPLMRDKFSKFNTAFMLFKALKMMVVLIFMVIWSLLNRDKALPFVLSTFFLYLVYMIFESRSLNRHSKNQVER
jgi:hypothetical protein